MVTNIHYCSRSLGILKNAVSTPFDFFQQYLKHPLEKKKLAVLQSSPNASMSWCLVVGSNKAGAR